MDNPIQPIPFRPRRRRVGRPATGRGVVVGLTISPALSKRVDASAFDHLENRREAIRRLLEAALDAERQS